MSAFSIVSATALLMICCLGLPDRLHAQTFSILHQFSYPRGVYPNGPVIQGNTLYGTTNLGGRSKAGTVYRLSLATGAFKTLYNFGGAADGAQPFGALLAVNDMLYGTTDRGGSQSCNCGTLYAVDRKSGQHKVVYDFTGGTSGSSPQAGLVYLRGALFGTTVAGGDQTCSCGTVYKFDLATGMQTILHAFQGGADGGSPAGELVVVAGQLYGVTLVGGSHNDGTLFTVDPSTGVETNLHEFAGGDDGTNPRGLAYDGGILYGSTYLGGPHCGKDGCGTVYSFDPGTGKEKVLYALKTQDGAEAGPVIAVGGTIYGTTFMGGSGMGSSGEGTLFAIDIATQTETLLYNFDADAPRPEGTLAYLKGSIFGVTGTVSHQDHGTIFRFTP